MDYLTLENEKAFSSFVSYYYDVFPTMQRIPVNIITTEDLNQTHSELRPENKARFVGANAELKNEDNGRMVVPYSINGTISILLNTKKLLEYTGAASNTWIGTIAHELTHAIDYYQMARKEGLTHYDPLEEISLYHMFQLWSEYHARKLGYRFLREYINKSEDSVNEQQLIEDIVKIEWPYHKNYYSECFSYIDENQQMYNTMQLLGRYSVWCDLFPIIFNGETLSSDFNNSPWMTHLFLFLREHENLDLIYNNFEGLRKTLSEKWPYA